MNRQDTDEAVRMMAKTVCAIAHSDGEVDEMEQKTLTNLIERSGVPVEILPSGQWGAYEVDVRGAFMVYAKR